MYNILNIQNCIIDESNMIADESANLPNKAIQFFERYRHLAACLMIYYQRDMVLSKKCEEMLYQLLERLLHFCLKLCVKLLMPHTSHPRDSI